MSSIKKCLDDLVAQGKLLKPDAARALEAANRAAAGYSRRMSEDAADTVGVATMTAELRRAAELRVKQTALQVLSINRAVNDATAHPNGIAAGVAATFARDVHGAAGYSNIEARHDAVLGMLHAKFASGLDAYRSKVAGLSRDVIGLTRFVRELFGENTGDATARAAAVAWKEAADYGAQRFIDAGGNLRMKKSWHLPQHWDDGKIRAAGAAKFHDYMLDALNGGRLAIRDLETGEPVNPLRALEIIDQAYTRIESGGLSDLVPGSPGGAKLANRRDQVRAFDWTTADAWHDFNRKFGVGDAQVYDLLTGHLDSMARDISLLEILGPNPDAAARVLIDHARKGGASEKRAYFLNAIYDQVTGRAASPVSEGVASFFRGVRAWLSSAQLGSAMLSSATDFAALTATAKWNGLPATEVLGRYISLLNPANAEDRLKAVRLGLVADEWARRASGATRHQAEVVGPELPGRIAEFVMRASGLSPHTQAGRWAFGMEFLGHLADNAGARFDRLDPKLQRAFARHGIDEAAWDAMRKAPMYRDAGVKFMWPEAMAKEGGAQAGAASKLLELVHTEMDFAIPTPGAFERAMMLGQTRPGTWSGEFLRSTAQYKTFPVTVMTTHLMRGLNAARAGDRGVYLASTFVGMTVMGAFAMQLKAIAQGKDPRDMTDGNFWGAAALQGGGLGIMGDFLYSGLNRSDQSFYMSTIGGPTAGLVDDLLRLTGANISANARDKDAHWGADLARFVRKNIPGSTIWYSRLALDRLVLDQLETQINPDYAARFARMEDRAMNDYQQQFWWSPGRAEPRRAPDLGVQ
jgi:hypothetical protein